ncbi:putative preprotein translocase, SecY subunit [Candidatus Zinderia insecticola CARI]|uniref:Putative preprotein translocase, SecY subunit n=1 Tax=Zinderia insecticola (strain CARI) TaxID=871271 RepID=E0TJ28_ZINIC|nr:putative preprotein translocase, SecY subunit [Candidatus Zinderia insecticola CARI]
MNNIKNILFLPFKNIVFIFIFTFIYIFGLNIKIPFLDYKKLSFFYKNNIISFLNIFCINNFLKFNIFIFNINFYILIIFFINLFFLYFKKYKKNKFIKYLNYIFYIIQILQIILFFNKNLFIKLKYNFFYYKFIIFIIILNSYLILSWIIENIKNICLINSISFIISINIFYNFYNFIKKIIYLYYNKNICFFYIFYIFICLLIIISLIIFFEKIYQKIKIKYLDKQIGNKIYKLNDNFIILKINPLNNLSIIFSYFLYFILNKIILLNIENFLFTIIFSLIFSFLNFIINFKIFNNKKLFNILNKNSGYILGIKRGKNMINYINKIQNNLFILNLFFTNLLILIPHFLFIFLKFPIYFNGISLIIVINFIFEIFEKIFKFFIFKKYNIKMK